MAPNHVPSDSTTFMISPSWPSYRCTASDSIPLAQISPRSMSPAEVTKVPHGFSNPEVPEVMPSPPPSFYRAANLGSDIHSSSHGSRSLSPKIGRKILFAAPPPPIRSSIHVLPSASILDSQTSKCQHGPTRRSLTAVDDAVKDPLVGLERKERAIQRELQLLLDAQSAGLLGGLKSPRGEESIRSIGYGEKRYEDAGSISGSSTPTTARTGKGSGSEKRYTVVVPVRQPKAKPISLRRARHGLLRHIGELVDLKEEERFHLTKDIEVRERLLGQVRVWEGRFSKIRTELADCASDQQTSAQAPSIEALELGNLQVEEAAIDAEIRGLEARLSQMRGKKQWLSAKIREVVNRREARLSSFRGALKEVEAEVEEFLTRPPTGSSKIMENEEGFLNLPSHRRTLSMANEWWGREAIQLKKKRIEVGIEKAALKDGAKIWKNSIDMVMGFEEDLRKETHEGDNGQDKTTLRRLAGRMVELIERLEVNAKVAEDRGWNLLICALGAELTAFREGTGILTAAIETLERAEASQEYQDVEDFEGTSRDYQEVVSNDVWQPGIETVDKQKASLEREDSEEDGPNLAELLIDHGAVES